MPHGVIIWIATAGPEDLVVQSEIWRSSATLGVSHADQEVIRNSNLSCRAFLIMADKMIVLAKNTVETSAGTSKATKFTAQRPLLF